MTVQELIAILQTLPPEVAVRVQFDVNDHDSTWALITEIRHDDDGAVVLVAA